MAASSGASNVKFCSNCGCILERRFYFCPGCGTATERKRTENLSTPSTSASSIKTSLPSFSLPSFRAFKARKETDRQTSFSKKSANKKRKGQDKDVVVQVGVMDENLKMKRGETIPLKVTSSATVDVILRDAVKKHSDFNKRFDNGIGYKLAFKDGSIVDSVPGTDPPEPFTLQKYKEVSGFGYSRIYLYLIPDTDNSDGEEISHDSLDEMDQLPPVTWGNDSDFHQSVDIDSAIVIETSSSGGGSCIVQENSSAKDDTKKCCSPWVVIDDSDSDDETIAGISLENEKNDFVEINDVQDLATLLTNHISSAVSLSTTVMFVIRRNKPWKSFLREMTLQKVTDTMDLEVKFTDSMDTIDDRGPRREFLRLLRNDMVESSGVFQDTANKGSYVLTHNASKLSTHEYYMAGRAFATHPFDNYVRNIILAWEPRFHQ